MLLGQHLVDAVTEVGRAFPGATAAFDADGTLWREDVGEAWLAHLVHKKLIRLADGRDPVAVYEALVARDRGAGFAYAAQLQAGISEALLHEEALGLVAWWVKPRLIAVVQELLALCERAGLVVTIVSASAIEIVRAAAPLAGVAAGRCVGMTVRIDAQGRCKGELVLPITYAAGKVEALAQRGLLPLALGAGDSLSGDLALLTAAKLPVVVAAKGGSPLADEARRRGWDVLVDHGQSQA